LWLIETYVFQLPQLHKTLTRYAPPFFDTTFKCRQDKSQEFKNCWERAFAGQNAGKVLIERPHEKSVKKIVSRTLKNEIDVLKFGACFYPVSPTNA